VKVSASLTAEEAARRRWDAVVVGAGPAGSLAALGLARRGADVLLADRADFPRWKVCGCCLNGAALAALAAAGLGSLPEDCGAWPLEGIWLAAGNRSAWLALGRAAVLSREALDAALVRAAVAAGVAFLPRTAVTLGGPSPDARSVALDDGGPAVTARAGVVVAADGLGGRLLARGDGDPSPAEAASRVGAGTTLAAGTAPHFYRAGAVYMACGAGGYAGVVRLEDGRLDVAAALDAAEVRAGRGPGPVVARLLAEAGWPVPPGLAGASWKGTPALTRRARHLATERVFAVGDAAGYVEPFTGEGIARALTAGLAVAALAARAARRWDARMKREWTAAYRHGPGGRQRVCRAAASALRRPRLAGALVGILSVVPALAGPFVRGLSTPYPSPPESL
jgi:flavin-dependent dehydrogenase